MILSAYFKNQVVLFWLALPPKQIGRDYSSKTVISSMAKRKFTAKPAMLNNVFNRAGISQIRNKTTPNPAWRVRASSRRPCNPRRQRLIRT